MAEEYRIPEEPNLEEFQNRPEAAVADKAVGTRGIPLGPEHPCVPFVVTAFPWALKTDAHHPVTDRVDTAAFRLLKSRR